MFYNLYGYRRIDVILYKNFKIIMYQNRKHLIFLFRVYQCCIEFIIARDLFFYTFRWIATNPAFYILIEWNTLGISFVHIFFVLLLSVMYL